MSTRKHLLYMVLAAVGVLLGLWLTGVPLQAAAPWALLLACPLMMIVMMVLMNRTMQSPGHDANLHASEEPEGPPSDAELRRVDERYRR